MKTKQCNGLSSAFRVTNHFVSFHTQPHCPTLRQGFFFSVSSKFAGNWSPSHLLKPVSRSLIQALLWLIALLQWQHFLFSHWSYIYIYIYVEREIHSCLAATLYLHKFFHLVFAGELPVESIVSQRGQEWREAPILPAGSVYQSLGSRVPSHSWLCSTSEENMRFFSPKNCKKTWISPHLLCLLRLCGGVGEWWGVVGEENEDGEWHGLFSLIRILDTLKMEMHAGIPSLGTVVFGRFQNIWWYFFHRRPILVHLERWILKKVCLWISLVRGKKRRMF